MEFKRYRIVKQLKFIKMKKNIKLLGTFAVLGLTFASCMKSSNLKGNFTEEISTETTQLSLTTSGYEVTETSPLQLSSDGCYTAGVLEYTKAGVVLAVVDFGSGTETEAAAQVNGVNSILELKKDDSKYKGKKSKYKKVVLRPLVKSDDCDYIVSGIIKYYDSKSGDWLATVDFGDGTCDDEAIKTSDDGDYTFTVSEYFN
ncbi:MAG: hypothetical protein ACI9N1_000744 [Flavobacteriales bacterium]|jgi:hypothetical protein